MPLNSLTAVSKIALFFRTSSLSEVDKNISSLGSFKSKKALFITAGNEKFFTDNNYFGAYRIGS